MDVQLLKVEIRYEQDVVLARRRARQIAHALNFPPQDQVRIATALSELVRNTYQYAQTGRVDFSIISGPPDKLIIRIVDQGAGIKNLDDILSGQYVSKTGMGVGLAGARRLVDEFTIDSDAKGTRIEIACYLPKRAPAINQTLASHIVSALASEEPQNPFEEMQRQNQELLAALDVVQRQQIRLTQLNLELEETNRGVVALSGELEQRADYQKRSAELKSEFLSTITHELRTPLNSIISISNILLDRLDGDLSDEQEKQIGFIRGSARDLSELVNDVLDLAKVEAGKIVIRPRIFEITEMFRVLRGMLKPLIQPGLAIDLIFEDAASETSIISDEGKVSQILRNFISNSLKFTKTGEVRVSAQPVDGDWFRFDVRDTGIGIAPEDQERIFEDFTQVEGDHQLRIHGTGLGLPLSRKLAIMLGGHVTVESALGVGSTFSLILPKVYQGSETIEDNVPQIAPQGPRTDTVLLIDDQAPDRYILRKAIENHTDLIIETATAEDGIRTAIASHPMLIFLDLGLPDIAGEEVLKTLKSLPETRDIPVVINSSKELSETELEALLTNATDVLSKSLSQSDRIRRIADIFHIVRTPAPEVSHV